MPDIPITQQQALLACVDAGQLRRTRDGYTTETGAKAYHQRSLYALVRAGLLEFQDGESRVRATPAGVRAAAELRAAKPSLRAAA